MQVISKNRKKQNGPLLNGTAAIGKKGLSVKRVDDYLRFIIFLALIGMLYIGNTHYAERQVKEIESLEKEVKDLKSKYLLRKSTLSAGTRFSELKPAADTLGLRPLAQPPYKLIKTKSNTE